ncbi:hypothetical protein F4779DRAFT_639227 [Xylariaceae sp. FL0662B]|nr:hypothetical protein F4779DRAFT_639227 [Xylariaceae sp. FL0662B]
MHLSVTLPALLASSSVVYACSITDGVKMTFYGSPDNDPPGSITVAHNCGGRNNKAGGTGTYADPVTFASAGSEYKVCETIYSPYLKKYLRMEDDCAGCTGKQIDVFTGNADNGGDKQIQCEDALTPDATQGVIRSPGQNLDVDTTALFKSGICNTQHVYVNNNPKDYC